MQNTNLKRERDEDSIDVPSSTSTSPTLPGEAAIASASGNSTTNFRNVSACNRCRTRKNRCDQKLPRCTGCDKAGVKCVGFDPVSKRTIPRSYVYYLETRLSKLEGVLLANGIPFDPPEEDFSISDHIRPGVNVPFPVQEDGAQPGSPRPAAKLSIDPTLGTTTNGHSNTAEDSSAAFSQGTEKARHAGTQPNVSFARVVFAAVRSTVSHTTAERGAPRPSKQSISEAATASSSARDSFFGLHTRPTIKPAAFPEEHIGRKLVDLYFEHANPQIPILHRGEFMSLFDRVYAMDSKKRSPRELYLLNIVFAIGSGIVMDASNVDRKPDHADGDRDIEQPSQKRARLSTRQHQPEEYHSSAVMHLENFLASPPATEGSNGGLEELQAVLLLAGLALLRPVAPGLWYIIGVAVRLAVDLGLHSEDIDETADVDESGTNGLESNSKGRKQWARDLRRRLWWCVYSFDRLVSTCVGRPFGITDQVVTTEFPSELDDRFITTTGFVKQPSQDHLPSYKLVATHYFRLRLLQSEILQVLQHRQAAQARARGANRANPYIHQTLLSPFMDKFATFREWRRDVDRRLWEWKQSAPEQANTGVAFTPLFLELNYWQAVIMLYRQSLAVPEELASEVDAASTAADGQSPNTFQEASEDEEMVFMKVAQAGQTVLKIYRQLHRLKLVNYTYLATHHLFMSGISFLYAIWHSPLVRSQLTFDDVDFTVLIATSVLGDLVAKCPPAEACRDAFARMSKVTIAMVERTTGFGPASTLSSQPLNAPDVSNAAPSSQHNAQDAMPHFDLDLRDLFSKEEITSRPLSYQSRLQALRSPQATRTFEPLRGLNRESLHEHQQSHRQESSNPSPTLMGPLDQSLSNRTPHEHFAQTTPQPQTQQSADFPFDSDMSFLDNTFPSADPSGPSSWNDFDLNFGTGGTGWDGSVTGGGAEDWDLGNVDMFGGFFFGGDGGGGNGSSGGL